jgi:hypothetical protein
MYVDSTLNLNNGDCSDTLDFSESEFEANGLRNILSTSSPDSGIFGLELYCSTTTSGNDHNPNLEYGDKAAFPRGAANFNSCYTALQNWQLSESIPFRELHSGGHLCVLHNDELAVVTFNSVSDYHLIGTVVMWSFLPGN